MTVEEQKSVPVATDRVVNPWILGVIALVIYAVCLNRWVTLRGLPWIAPITGWDWHPISTFWHPAYFSPLWVVCTFPFRILPVSLQPVALNFFSAVCATVTLVLLAQSVRLLPQDRTREQRIREHGAFSLLSGRWAFVPQVLAVAMLGFQSVFWSNAVSASNEMLDLMVFAFLVYCLLRYRIAQNENWLNALALVYGAGLSNNYALIGFFPFFLAALVWIKGLGFFNIQFIARMILLGLLGMSLYLLLPLLGSIGPQAQPFGATLLDELKQQSLLLRLVPGWIPLIACLSSIAPLLCAGFHWPEIEGELSAVGNALTRITFMAMNVLFLPVCLLIFYNWHISTNPAMHEAPSAFLPFYYLAALAAAYYTGYILVVFGKRPLLRAKFNTSRTFNRIMLACLAVLFFVAPLGLAWSNLPQIRSSNNGVLQRYAAETIAALPTRTAIVISDDPIRLQLLEAGYRKAGIPNPHIMLETGSLPHKQYFAYLENRYPQLQKRMAPLDKFPPRLAPTNVVDFISQLGRDYAIYYLNPSFGYFFEQFYLRPHQLVYEMKADPPDSYLPPPPTPAEIQENQKFWSQVEQTSLKRLPAYLADDDWDADRVSVDYSVALDFWGVELQRANHLADAHAAFAEACSVNTNNLMARFNLEYNEQLQKGNRQPLANNDTMDRALSFYGSVPTIIRYNGPPDEPNVDMAFGQMLAQGGNLHQGAALFERRLQLLPNDIPAEMAVAKTLVDTGRADRALALTRLIRSQTRALPDELFWVEAVACLTRTNYAEAERILEEGNKQEPDNPVRLANTMEFYRRTGQSVLYHGHHQEGVDRLKKALPFAAKLADLLSTGKVTGGKLSLADVLLLKADIEVSLEMWDPAIQSLGRLLDIDPDNSTALMSRAAIFIKQKKYDQAKDDAATLLRSTTPRQKFLAYGAMTDIARAENDIPGEMKYMRLYLKSVPAASAQYAAMKRALDNLQGH